jgi:hypothetical protein
MEFRKKIQATFNQLYSFRIIQPLAGKNCYQFIKENFSQLNGKLYRSKSNKNYLVLALMKCDDDSKKLWKSLNVSSSVIEKEMAENDIVLQNIQSYFYVSKTFSLDTGLQIEEIPNAGTLEPLSKQPNKSGVLMVMMERYSMRSVNFLPSGKVAIGLKMTKDSMEIVEHISNIGYVLFHHRSAEEQHFFAVKDICSVVSSADVEADRYKNVQTSEMYISVNIDTSAELEASKIDSTKKECTKETRYDAQYAELSGLKLV